MKLKKKIMLVVSMAIMTLSVFLSDMQVMAANTDYYKYVNYSDKVYTRDYMNICTIELLESGDAVNVNGTVYRYDGSGMFNVELTANMPIFFQYLTTAGNDAIYFSDDTTDLLWFFHCVVNWDWVEMLMNNSAELKCSMSLLDLNLNVYGQSYDVPFESNSGLQDPSLRGVVEVDDYIYIQNVPETRHLSTKDCELEAKFLLSFSFVDYLGSDMSFVPRWRYSLYGLKFYEFYGFDSMHLKAILDSLNEIKGLTENQIALLRTYFPHLTDMLLRLTHMDLDFDEMLTLTEDILAEFEKANITLDNIDFFTEKQYGVLLDISEELVYLANNLLASNEVDKNTTNDFKQDSDSQSSQLNNLNQQTQMDRIDVDNVSSSVDANIDDNAVANYGVVLSSITGNGKVVQLMLIVLSVGLVSYVLYGKR